MSKRAPLLNKEPYHVRRVCGQLAGIPSAWWVIVDKVDLHPADVCVRLKFAEEKYLAGGVRAYRATDEGRAAWDAFKQQGASK